MKCYPLYRQFNGKINLIVKNHFYYPKCCFQKKKKNQFRKIDKTLAEFKNILRILNR